MQVGCCSCCCLDACLHAVSHIQPFKQAVQLLHPIDVVCMVHRTLQLILLVEGGEREALDMVPIPFRWSRNARVQNHKG